MSEERNGVMYKNGVYYGNASSGGGDTSSVEITQAEYDALPESEKTNGTVYYITDGTPSKYKVGFYGECDTPAITYEKEVEISGVTELYPGLLINVKFVAAKNMNAGAGTMTLNVNSLGAKPMVDAMGNALGFHYHLIMSGNRCITFVYDGSNWVWTNEDTQFDGENVKTTEFLSGSSGTSVESVIPRDTTMDSAITTLLKNDNALKTDLGNKSSASAVSGDDAFAKINTLNSNILALFGETKALTGSNYTANYIKYGRICFALIEFRWSESGDITIDGLPNSSMDMVISCRDEQSGFVGVDFWFRRNVINRWGGSNPPAPIPVAGHSYTCNFAYICN